MKIDKSARPKTLAERKNSADDTRPQFEPTPPSAAQTSWQRRAQWVRNHPLVVILEAAGLVGLIFAVGIFFYELRERQDERVARSWQLLTTPAPGNSGKREAIEYLNNEYGCIPIWRALIYDPTKSYVTALSDKDIIFYETDTLKIGIRNIEKEKYCWKNKTILRGVDLSAKTHRESVYLTGVELNKAYLGHSNLSGAQLQLSSLAEINGTNANFSGAQLYKVDMRRSQLLRANFSNTASQHINFAGAMLRVANFNNAQMRNANLREAVLSQTTLMNADISFADFRGATIEDSDLTNAHMVRAIFDGSTLMRVNVSGANFKHTNFDAAKVALGVWAYSDNPPINVSRETEKIVAVRFRNEPWEKFVARIKETNLDWAGS